MFADVTAVLHLVIADVPDLMPVLKGVAGNAARAIAVFDERLQHLWSNHQAKLALSSLIGGGGTGDPAGLFTSSGVLPRWQRCGARGLGAAAPEFMVVVLERMSRRLRTVVIPALDPDLHLRAMILIFLEELEEPESLLALGPWQPLLQSSDEAFLLCDGSGRLVCKSDAVQRYFGEPVVSTNAELPYQNLLAAGEGVPLREAHRLFLSGTCVAGQAEAAVLAVDGTTRQTVVRWVSCAAGRFPVAKIDIIATTGIAIGSAEITETEIDRSELPAASRTQPVQPEEEPSPAVSKPPTLHERDLETIVTMLHRAVPAATEQGALAEPLRALCAALDVDQATLISFFPDGRRQPEVTRVAARAVQSSDPEPPSGTPSLLGEWYELLSIVGEAITMDNDEDKGGGAQLVSLVPVRDQAVWLLTLRTAQRPSRDLRHRLQRFVPVLGRVIEGMLDARGLEQAMGCRDLLVAALGRMASDMLVLDPERTVIAAGRDAAVMLGATSDELAGCRLEALLEPQPCEVFDSILEQAAASGEPLCGVLDGHSRFGQELSVALSVEARTSPEGSLHGFLVCLHTASPTG